MLTIFIAAALGYWVTHSIWGALVGGIIGWVLTSARTHQRRRPPVGDFVEPLFGILGAVSKADGHVSSSEIQIAEKLMHRMGLNEAQRKTAQEAFNQGKQPGFDTEAAMLQLRHWTAGRRDHAMTVLDVVVETVLSEGATQAKLNLLQQLARHLGISQMQLMALMAMKGYSWQPGGGQGGSRGWQGWQTGAGGGYTPPHRQQTGPDPYTVLGVERDADERTIKRAYRKLISEHHPDRMNDLPEEMRKRAQERASEINAAYERVKEERGFK